MCELVSAQAAFLSRAIHHSRGKEFSFTDKLGIEAVKPAADADAVGVTGLIIQEQGKNSSPAFAQGKNG